jgi:two-component system, NarL family, response regulator DevR
MLRVLVADDSTQIRERILKLLSEVEKAEVVGVASDGIEAIEETRDLKPDLVILDLHMPRVGGFDILPTIKAVRPPPLVMVLTNYASNRHREVATRLGADYFFDKSVEFDKAIEVIESLAGSETY